jgi:hypothetical protein
MFTVKVVYYDGSENIWQTRNVLTRAQERPTSTAPLITESIWFQTDDGAEIAMSGNGATVYVMNDNGKTVSAYALGGEQNEPVGVAGSPA